MPEMIEVRTNVTEEALELMKRAAINNGAGTSNADAVRFAAMQYLRMTGALPEGSEQPVPVSSR